MQRQNVLRGGLFVLPMLSNEISRVLRFAADPNKRLIDMITPPTAKIGVVAFLLPVEQGTLAPRAPEVHFQTFVEFLISAQTGASVVQEGRVSKPAGLAD